MDIKFYSLNMWTAELERLFGKGTYTYEKIERSGNLSVYLANRLLCGTFHMDKHIGYIYDRRENVRSVFNNDHKVVQNLRLKAEDYRPGKQLYA